ncbi:uncharacterized protein LTR77_004692 [Saxophila tyrrhenica]|uniref:Mitochondrial outer membrane protein n=1 Tax=Saxophila tyrrhenica TaxID=1690608 RepID=A0AAV9PE52_9PEZI|nr:hypothetical protein LTR77_004692 [Saxophila tyrrhenica]
MSSDEPVHDDTNDSKQTPAKPSEPAARSNRGYSIFTVPAPLKRIFDRFPLVTYAENDAPLRAPTARDTHGLHIFTTASDARNGRPSFNPACLKWQTFLKIAGAPFHAVASSNHASPSGSLPFLLPTAADQATTPAPIPSSKLRRWVNAQSGANKSQEPLDVRGDAYPSLLEDGVRKAWLYQLYINPANAALVDRLYVSPCSSNIFVRMTTSHQLQQAAQHELSKASASNTIHEADVLQEAAASFEALSTLLDSDEWFFGRDGPGLFDASVFAYTHLILDSDMQWQDNALSDALMDHGNLVKHRDRMVEMYY